MARGDGIRLLLQMQDRSRREDGGVLPGVLALARMIASASPTAVEGQAPPSQTAATSVAPAGGHSSIPSLGDTFEWLSPFKGDAELTSEFNLDRVHPVYGDVRPHRGVDFGLPLGTPVLSMGPGTVGEVSYQPEGAGNYISVDHPGGITSRYFHLQDLPQFAPGTQIYPGQQIGAVGNTGVSTGPHLQLETLRDGQHVNPREILPWLGQRYPL